MTYVAYPYLCITKSCIWQSGRRKVILFSVPFCLEDGASPEEREAAASTLRELREAMFDLEHRHRVYQRSLARETKYGSKSVTPAA